MSEERRDEKLARQAREAFDQSVAGLDGQTRSRLARARAAALEAGRSRGTFWLPASGMRLGLTGALAAAALAVVVIVQAPRPASEVEIMAFDDIERSSWTRRTTRADASGTGTVARGLRRAESDFGARAAGGRTRYGFSRVSRDLAGERRGMADRIRMGAGRSAPGRRSARHRYGRRR
jgi:hypothetical protein